VEDPVVSKPVVRKKEHKMNIILSQEEAERVISEDHEDWIEVDGTREIIDQRRWVTEVYAVFTHTPTKKFYSLDWEEGSTEMQEGTEPFYGDQTLIEMEYKEVTKMEWVAKKVKNE
jgi:hypothetical protein